MNREVGRFLLETWQLFYWSFFCPSLLQERMNNLLPQKTKEGLQKNTFAGDILLSQTNARFVIQCLLFYVIFSLPIAGMILSSGRVWDLLLWFAAIVISYCINFWFLPTGIGVSSSLILALTYWQQSKLLETSPLETILLYLPPLPQLFTGIGIGAIILLVKSSLVWMFLKHISLSSARQAYWIGSGLSFFLGCWIASENLFGTLVISGFISLVMFAMRDIINSDDDAFEVAMSVIMDIAIFASLVVLFVAVFMTVNFITIAVLSPLPFFLISCASVAFTFAPIKRLWGILIPIVLIVLGWGTLNFNALWAIPVFLIGYHRILPDYLLSCLASLILTKPLLKKLALNPSSLLTKLPPYTTEFIWLPLPNHDQILADTFRQKNTILLGLRTFQKMQEISLPGFNLTIQKALASIVAYRFADVSTTADLIESVMPKDSFDIDLEMVDNSDFDFDYPRLNILNPATQPQLLLPLLIPALYNEDDAEFSAPPKTGNIEIDILFPLLQQTAKDTASALKASSSALRERGLERLVDKLKILPAQLPGLGLKPQAVKRWQPAIERWQHILELEIAEQQKTSQGELLNPFQFGNPLRPDRAAIFKGRQDFADRLVRLILDRNRPTLVLHGPRRAGKTSFLLNLPRLLPSDLVPIYLDMQQGSMTASEGDFCYGLVRAIDRDTRSQGLQLPPIPSREAFYARPYPSLEDWLDLALPQLGERRLLLNLDEFEKIGSAIKGGRISDRLFDQLRSMIQHYDRLGFLFSGVQTLEELGPRWSNYFISVVPMEMHYLEPHEAEDLLRHPDPEFIFRYDTGIADEILHLTRCQPYLLQLIGSALVNQANRQHTQLATTTLLQAAIQDAFTNGEPYFTNIWTEFTGTTPAEVTAGQQILIALAQGKPPYETVDETTISARRRLLRYHIIECLDRDTDRIEIPLFEQWVRERSIAN